MPSPICTVDVGAGPLSTTNGVDAAAGASCTIQLADLSAYAWTIAVVGTDDASSAPALTINNTTRTATFTAGAVGTATRFQSTTRDSQGVATSTTFAVYVRVGGRRIISLGETTEGNSAAGWVAQQNAAIRGAVPAYVNVSSGTATLLTAAQAVADYIVLTGTTGGSHEVDFPNLPTAIRPNGASFTVRNATNHAVTILDLNGATQATINAGSFAFFLWDDDNGATAGQFLRLA